MSNIFANAGSWVDQGSSQPPTSWTGAQYEVLQSDPVSAGAVFSMQYLGTVQAGDTLQLSYDVANFDPAPSQTGYLNVVRDGSVVESRTLSDGATGTIDLVLDAGSSYTIVVGNSAGSYSTGNFYELQAILVPLADTLEAVDDFATTPYQTPVVVPVLDNDTIDGVAPVPVEDVTMSIETAPGNGTVEINSDGTITYTPNAGFSGTDTFVYRITEVAPPVAQLNVFCAVDEFSSLVFYGDPPDGFSATTGILATGDGWTAYYEYVDDPEPTWVYSEGTGTPPGCCPTEQVVTVSQGEGVVSFLADLTWFCG